MCLDENGMASQTELSALRSTDCIRCRFLALKVNEREWPSAGTWLRYIDAFYSSKVEKIIIRSCGYSSHCDCTETHRPFESRESA